MAVNSIPGDVAALTLQPLKPSVSLDLPIRGTPSINDPLPHSKAKLSVVDTYTNNTDSPVDKQTQVAAIGCNNNTVRAMSHIVVEYTMKGNIRIKYIDNKNNVTYQIPSEMVTKVEDQMMQLETFTTVKI